jgi:MoaA/NifB/PqqE/SkfB family radical SAM enzyme
MPSPIHSPNVKLNLREFAEGQELLASTPRHVTLGTHNACNAKCIFCLEGAYARFNLALYKDFFEAKAGHFIRAAESVTFTGFGEILWVPGIEEFLDHINETLPNVKKIFTTNGTPLKSPVVERLLTGDYVIQISLHAANPALHRKLTQLEDQFEPILDNIRALVALRSEKRARLGLSAQNHPHLRLFSVLNIHNIDDVSAFVQQAHDLGVQSVRCFYMTMFAPEHIEQSCAFDPERANRSIQKAAALVERLRKQPGDESFKVELPPLFGEHRAQAPTRCTDPWQHLYVELQGSVQPCCFWGTHVGDLNQGDSIDGIWNGEFQRSLRKGMASGAPLPSCRSCVRYNNFNVDDLLCHITNRPEVQRSLLTEIVRRGLLKSPSPEMRRLLEPAAAPPART